MQALIHGAMKDVAIITNSLAKYLLLPFSFIIWGSLASYVPDTSLLQNCYKLAKYPAMVQTGSYIQIRLVRGCLCLRRAS